MLMCDECESDQPDVEECQDPYTLEVNNEIWVRNLCDMCYQDRMDSV